MVQSVAEFEAAEGSRAFHARGGRRLSDVEEGRELSLREVEARLGRGPLDVGSPDPSD